MPALVIAAAPRGVRAVLVAIAETSGGRSVSEFFEIAYATVNKGLCVFTGTGFSKAISKNKAPGWQELLEGLCEGCADATALKKVLFPASGKNPLSLEESAQVLSIELLKSGRSIHQDIAEAVGKVKLKGDNSSVKAFCESQCFQVVTTNYDKLIEELCGEKDCQTLTPGLPVPRSPARVKVYHVHGSIDVPETMVVTADDYFRFLNSESYFSRKLSTILHENTVVILGYSLGDTNLKAIISDYNSVARSHTIGSNIFLVSRGAVPKPIKDYYSNCYGIRVIDEMDVSDFFDNLNSQIDAAKDCLEGSIENIKKVVGGGHSFTPKYLSIERSFYEIVSSLSAAGFSLGDKNVVAMFGDIIEKKTDLTRANGAWEQYTHLANWLIYLASILEIGGTSIEKEFLKSVKRSMETMSKDLKLGYSWHAYKAWRAKWDGIAPKNRNLIKDHITSKAPEEDALAIVNLG